MTRDEQIVEMRTMANTFDGRIPGIVRKAEEMISSGLISVENFRAWMTANIPPMNALNGSYESRSTHLGVPAKDLNRYSIGRALATCGTPQWGGVERELSDEVTRIHGQPKGNFWLPYDVLNRALAGQGVATASLGGNLVPTTMLDFIPMLQNKAVVARLNPRVLTGLSATIDIPRGYHSTVATWRTEVESSVASDLGIQKLTLNPQCITARTAYSKQLLITGNQSIDEILKSDMVTQIGLAIDRAATFGAGSAAEPAGIYGQSGVNMITLAADGASFSTMAELDVMSALVSMETSISASNGDGNSMAMITNPQVRGALRCKATNTNSEQFIWTTSPIPAEAQQGIGRVIGYPAYTTAQVYHDRTVGACTTASTIFMADWSQLILAFFGSGLDILTDPYGLAASREIQIFASQYMTIGLRHPEAFSCLVGINAG